jgi:hypothetical protein
MGSSVEMAGIYVIIAISIIIINIKGRIAIVILSREISAIPQPTNRHIPRGGVAIPTARFTTMIIPK